MKEHPQLEWTPQRVAAFWDYQSRHPENYFTYRISGEILRQLKRHLAGRDAILDYGCGAGHLLDELLARGYRAAGMDFSARSVAAVAEQFGSRSGFLGAYTPDALGAGTHRFDAILVLEVVEHLYDDVLEIMLKDLRGLLRPGGVVIFSTPNEENLAQRTVLCPCCEQTFHRWQHVRSWSEHGLRRHLEQHDLRVIDSFTTDFSLALKKKKKWRSFKKRLGYRLNPAKKRPNLVVVCGQ